MRSRILSMGEALVDVLPDGEGLWRPVPGGSSYNVALALGRLGAPASFVGRLSRDEQGERMTQELVTAGVSTDLLSRDERPSPLSLVERGTQARSARYAIHLADTAHAPPDLPPNWRDGAAHLHVSSFSAVVGDWGRAVAQALDSANGALTRSFDVNIRPALLPEREATRALVADRMAHVEMVKASEEDLGWLFPDEAPLMIAAHWSAQGPAVLVTRGADGASIFIDGAPTHSDGFPAAVVDTVGAGDAFMAAFLAHSVETGVLGDLSAAGSETLGGLLAFANAAAALCCMKAGADAPTLAEVDAFLTASPSR